MLRDAALRTRNACGFDPAWSAEYDTVTCRKCEMFSITIIRRLLLGRLATRLFVALLAFAVLFPSFSCRCSDGSEVLFCVPGDCGRCASSAADAIPGRSCCASQSTHRCCGSTPPRDLDPENCGLSSGGSCCDLVINSSTAATRSQGLQIELTQAISYFSSEPMPGLLAAVKPHWLRPFDIEAGPPPIDLVIAQRCLTL